jgi:hypothetical protein
VGGYAPRARDCVRPRRSIHASGQTRNFTVRCHMLERMRFRPFQPLLVVLSVTVVGCDVLGFDHSTRVAKALVYHVDGKPDNAATTAAINARFPSGSKFTDLQSFVKSLDGRCFKTLQGRPMCEIPVSGAFCVSHVIFLSIVALPDDTIQHIEAHEGTEAC